MSFKHQESRDQYKLLFTPFKSEISSLNFSGTGIKIGKIYPDVRESRIPPKQQKSPYIPRPGWSMLI